MGRNAVIVLDTCAIIWDALGSDALSANAKKAIDKADNEGGLTICDISFWEIAMLIRKGRLDVGVTAAEFSTLFTQSRNVTVQPITPEIAELSLSFGAEINIDPADRIIAATALQTGAALVTADNNLRSAAMIKTLW